ncbi:MAG: hypothetical protein M0T72_07185 [Candidatus Dormibacteraeota bacterium]|jgi:hypothetical protein|nr:hypothetical protein [Candidatus Dormibacteraeota bacterium]
MSESKARLRRKLAREAATIQRRLETAVTLNLAGPLLGRANIAYELSERAKDHAPDCTSLTTSVAISAV